MATVDLNISDGNSGIATPVSIVDKAVLVSVGGTVAPTKASTGTKSNVSGSASSVTILASNASRKGASVYNDSSAILYLDVSGGTASTTSYSVQLVTGAYFEVPANYTGVITGIWASATGAARVTEYT